MADRKKATLAEVAAKKGATANALSRGSSDSASTILTLKQFSRRHDPTTVIPYARVSQLYKPWQEYRDKQIEKITDAANEYGHKLHKPFFEVAPRWKLKPDSRPVLVKAVKLAREKGWPIVVKDVTRLVGFYDQHIIPSKKRISKFLSLYPDVQFLVVIPNDKIKSERAKGSGGDRMPGWTKRRETQLGWMVRRLHDENAMGPTEIKQVMDMVCSERHMREISLSTIKRWLRQ